MDIESHTLPRRHPRSPSEGPQGHDVLVADIGASFIRLGRVGANGRCELLATAPTPTHDWKQFSDTLLALVVAQGGSAGLSLSVAGVVSPQTGEVLAANLPCLAGQPLAQALQERLGVPVSVTNDADCAALAEARMGAGAGHGVVFCAVLGSGVGGGLVIHGQLVRGAGGLTGEWGHAPVVNEALVRSGHGVVVRIPRFRCGCGLTGCLDTVGGARGLERLHAFLHRTERTSRQLLAAWAAAEPTASATLRAYIDLVAGPLALVVNTTGASIVPVCGGLGRSHELVAALDAAVRERVLHRSHAALVVPSMLGDQAGLIGAAHALHGGPA